MGEGGSSSGASAGSGAVAAATSEGAVATSDGAKSSKEGVSEGTKEASPEAKTEKVGAVIDAKPVTVEEVKDKSTINKDAVEKPKHKHAERLAKAYPDRQFSGDEDYDKALDEHLSDLEGYRERGTKANAQLVQLFDAEPWVADLVRSMINGESGRVAISRHFSAEDFISEPGDEDHEALEKNKKERAERIEKSNKFNQQFNENVEFSTKTIDEFAKENNLKPEEAQKFFDDFDLILADIYAGKITKETLTKIMRAVKHDEAVQAAKEEGEIKGRNEKITIEKEKESAIKEKTDGLPVLGKTGEESKEEEVRPVSKIDQILENTKRRTNF